MTHLTRFLGLAVLLCAFTNPSPAPAAERTSGSASGRSKVSDAGTDGDGDFTIGPAYANAPELTVKDGVPRGVVTQFVMNSEDSKVYPGIAKRQPGVVPYKRKVWVYVPKQYVAGTAAPFIVAQDGGGYVKTLVPVLDTLIHEKRLPVMAAIL